MINIPLNADVEATDGLCGSTIAVVIDADTLTVSHYVVREKADPDAERLVPVDKVTKTTANYVWLNCNAAEVSNMAPFTETEYQLMEIPRYVGVEYSGAEVYTTPEIVNMPIKKTLVPEGKRSIYEGIAVEATDGFVGQVDELLADEDTGQVSHFILRQSKIWGQKDVLMPVSVVDYADEDTVYLKLDKNAIAQMLAVPTKQRQGSLNIEVQILMLDDAKAANTVLKHIKKGEIPILNAAVLSKNSDGKTALMEVEDVEGRQGAIFGAVTGSLIGLLAGPIGAIVGAAAGAATGGAAARWIDMGFPDDYLQKLQEQLSPGSSALVLLVEAEQADALAEQLSSFSGDLLRHTLSDEAVNQLAKNLEKD